MKKENTYARLTKPLLELSISDDYDEAKKEWRMTGNVWRGSPPRHPCNHINQCLCGKGIVWHFEIENTNTNRLEILGSSCIENWMVLRHLTEMKGMRIEDITDEVIEEWLTNAVNVIKAEWWFKEYGEVWNLMYETIKDIDPRVNVHRKGRIYDTATNRYEYHRILRKRGKGTRGLPGYQMASIIWRWNHPDNPRRQQEKYGWPQEALFQDTILLYGQVNEHLERIKAEDEERENRIELIRKNREEGEKLMRERREKQDAHALAQALREEKENEIKQETFLENCEWFGIEPFDISLGKNDWEKRFLASIRSRIIAEKPLTENQMATFERIRGGIEAQATEKQKAYLRRLGLKEIPDGLTKAGASELIDEVKGA